MSPVTRQPIVLEEAGGLLSGTDFVIGKTMISLTSVKGKKNECADCWLCLFTEEDLTLLSEFA